MNNYNGTPADAERIGGRTEPTTLGDIDARCVVSGENPVDVLEGAQWERRARAVFAEYGIDTPAPDDPAVFAEPSGAIVWVMNHHEPFDHLSAGQAFEIGYRLCEIAEDLGIER